MAARRFASGAGLSLLITFGLLFVMQALIARDELDLPEPTPPFTLEFVRLLRDTPVEEKERVPARPELKEAPPIVDIAIPTSVPGGEPITVIEPGPVDTGLAPGGLGSRDSDAIATIRVAPIYPATLAARGIEGWVELEFAIGKAGEVLSPRVIASSHGGFERSALKAIRRWRYEPKIENGEPVVRQGLRVRLSFQLDQARV